MAMAMPATCEGDPLVPRVFPSDWFTCNRAYFI